MVTFAAYDSSRNFVTSSTDNRGNVTTTEYETLPSGKISGRPLAVLTSVTYGQKAASGEIGWEPSPAVTYSYSPEGRLIARSSSATGQSFAYDFLGRVIRSSTTDSGLTRKIQKHPTSYRSHSSSQRDLRSRSGTGSKSLEW